MSRQRTKPHEQPCADKHTWCPTGYVHWHTWAEKKAKTHEQRRCPDCGLWAIWVRKERP